MRNHLVPGLVSVIIPVFNSSEFISETIRSVTYQTYKNIEIIVVDDFSVDNSKELVESLSKEYSNIHLVPLQKNSGVAVARNTGINVARGQYIAFLDSDDLWKPNKIQSQIEYMNTVGAAFSFTGIEMIDEFGNIKKSMRKVKKEINYKFLLRNTMIATSTVVIDRNRVEKFQMPLMRSGQDYATWLMILRRGYTAYGIALPLSQYRLRQNSLSSNKLRSIKQVYQIQKDQEGLHRIPIIVNISFFIINALKKYFL